MAVLVLYASKHGSTKGIAEHIAAKLRESGHETQALPIDAAAGVASFDAVVLGSAVYYGSWMKEAVEYIHQHQAELAQHPVWLFSVGPLGVEVKENQEQPKELAEFRETIRPRDHHLFFGALDHNKLSFPERMVIKAVRAPEGDFRDWNDVDAWTDSIVRSLAPTQPEQGSTATAPGPA